MLTLAEHAGRTSDMLPHLATLTRLAASEDVIVELGVRSAVSTWALLDGMQPDRALVSVDLTWDERIPFRVATDPRWTFVEGDDRDPEVRKRLPHAGLVLIDTSHEYHHTLAELEWARAMRVPRILLHDWTTPDVEDAVRGFIARTPYGLWFLESSEWGLVGLSL